MDHTFGWDYGDSGQDSSGEHHISPSYSYPEPNRFEHQIQRLELAIKRRDAYIDRLERHLTRLQYYLRQRVTGGDHNEDSESDSAATNYAGLSTKRVYPHDTGKKMTNDEMMAGLLPQVAARSKDFSCMKSCNYLKNAKQSKDSLSQYMYLMICAEGCKKTIPCLEDSYCMPVMKENPDYFVQCVNGCELFKIAPKLDNNWL
ncbi:unnamed protein product [Medioppia subpectinata]|uniref:Uncharacterized protein n=1 Tax=Medioppia subpectinata TaxID=1979941 RepID=A0A7R9Q6M2_9ACAR|nr:unnamed protein product [Medioppia subpectinata]CAG2113992.1 unnamed protein product [Medioppia subpectinata]